jgi:hypothetical protein
MKTGRLKITATGYLIFTLMACTPVANPNVSNDVTSSSSAITPTALVLPPQGASTPMSPNLPTPAASGLEDLIQKAKEDLARRLSISTNEINLVEARDVIWPDSSLGCPQKGMVYAQVLTPGYLILLEHGGNTFEYHTSKRSDIINCNNPSPPVPGIPDNT